MATEDTLSERVKRIEATLAQNALGDVPPYLKTLHKESQAVHMEIIQDVETLETRLDALSGTLDPADATTTDPTPTGTDDTESDAVRRLTAKLDDLETDITDLRDRLDHQAGS